MSSSFLSNKNLSPEDREFVVADICDEYFMRRKRGESPSLDEYTQRFPDLSHDIRAAVQALMLLNGSGDPSGSKARTVLRGPEIAGFTIKGEVGRGGIGVVYDAVQLSDNRRVAIKVLKAQGRLNLNLQERFLREAAVSARLEHPHIVRCIGSGRVGDDAFMAMEFIDGHNFHQALEYLLLPETEGSGNELSAPSVALRKTAEKLADYRNLAAFGADIASALSYAHGQRVIHRDIKPANLIVDIEGKAWVADFGLAKIFKDDGNLSRTGDMIGTPRYMAPEQVRGVCSTHSDIYSLGVTLYEFAARKRAWESVAKNQLLNARASMELPALTSENSEVPPGLAKIITKACAFDPADRYESAAELELVLRRFADGKQNADRRNRERMEDDTFIRRKPILVSLGIISGLTAAVMLLANSKVQPAMDTPAKIISVLSDEKILTQAIDSLPESPDEDTLRKKLTRHATAIQAKGLVDDTIDEYIEDTSDREWVKETSEELVDAYKNGDISKQDAREVITGAGALISMIRIGSSAQKIKQTTWPEKTKQFGTSVINELQLAMNSGTMSKATSSRLKKLIPDRKVVGQNLDQALQQFVTQSWSALNRIPGIPKGTPSSPERLRFFEAAQMRLYKKASR